MTDVADFVSRVAIDGYARTTLDRPLETPNVAVIASPRKFERDASIQDVLA